MKKKLIAILAIGLILIPNFLKSFELQNEDRDESELGEERTAGSIPTRVPKESPLEGGTPRNNSPADSAVTSASGVKPTLEEAGESSWKTPLAMQESIGQASDLVQPTSQVSGLPPTRDPLAGNSPTGKCEGAVSISARAPCAVGTPAWAVFNESEGDKWKEWGKYTSADLPTSNTVWDGSPTLQVWVRSGLDESSKLLSILYQSVLLYWPSTFGTFVVTLDDEPHERAYGEVLETLLPYPITTYSTAQKFNSSTCNKESDALQMYEIFNADIYTTAEVIALMEPDSLLISPIVNDSLFSEGKPIVIGKQTIHSHEGRTFKSGIANGRWAESTDFALGQLQVADFSWSTPVLIWRTHFEAARIHVMKNLNASSFDQAFRVLMGRFRIYNSLNIILNYCWYHHREMYDWHLQSLIQSPPEMTDGVYNRVRPRVGTHVNGFDSEGIYMTLRQSYCHSCSWFKNCLVPGSNATRKLMQSWIFENMFVWEGLGLPWREPTLGKKGDTQAVQMKWFIQLQKTNFQFGRAVSHIFQKNVTYYAEVRNAARCRNYNEKLHDMRISKLQRQWRPKLINYFMNFCEMLFNGTRVYHLTGSDTYQLSKRRNQI